MRDFILNTDVHGYLEDAMANGFPKSSTKTRVFEPSKTNPRDMVIQPYPAKMQTRMMAQKQAIYLSDIKTSGKNKGRSPKFERSFLFEDDEKFFNDYLGRFTDKKDTLHETCMAMPCDIAICLDRGDGQYHVDFIHLLFPNGWGADESIGAAFQDFHEEVKFPTTGRHVVPTADTFPQYLGTCGKVFERIGAFSLRDRHRLDDHPSTRNDEIEFGEDKDGIFVRFEREVVVSIPEKKAFFFIIHTHLVDIRAYPELFLHAMENCSPDSYTMAHWFEDDDLKQTIKEYLNVDS